MQRLFLSLSLCLLGAQAKEPHAEKVRLHTHIDDFTQPEGFPALLDPQEKQKEKIRSMGRIARSIYPRAGIKKVSPWSPNGPRSWFIDTDGAIAGIDASQRTSLAHTYTAVYQDHVDLEKVTCPEKFEQVGRECLEKKACQFDMILMKQTQEDNEAQAYARTVAPEIAYSTTQNIWQTPQCKYDDAVLFYFERQNSGQLELVTIPFSASGVALTCTYLHGLNQSDWVSLLPSVTAISCGRFQEQNLQCACMNQLVEYETCRRRKTSNKHASLERECSKELHDGRKKAGCPPTLLPHGDRTLSRYSQYYGYHEEPEMMILLGTACDAVKYASAGVADRVREEEKKKACQFHMILMKQTQGNKEELGNLPSGWESATDAKSGKIYYFNRATGIRQWNRPDAQDARTVATEITYNTTQNIRQIPKCKYDDAVLFYFEPQNSAQSVLVTIPFSASGVALTCTYLNGQNQSDLVPLPPSVKSISCGSSQEQNLQCACMNQLVEYETCRHRNSTYYTSLERECSRELHDGRKKAGCPPTLLPHGDRTLSRYSQYYGHHEDPEMMLLLGTACDAVKYASAGVADRVREEDKKKDKEEKKKKREENEKKREEKKKREEQERKDKKQKEEQSYKKEQQRKCGSCASMCSNAYGKSSRRECDAKKSRCRSDYCN